MILSIIILILFLFRNYLNIDTLLVLVNRFTDHPLAPLIFILIYAVSVTFVVPAAALTLVSGPLFGLVGGVIVTTIGANLGCHISYFLAKILGKDVITKYIKGGSFVEKARESATKNGFEFMMYARLIPLFPFAGVNYLSGIIGIRYLHYSIATFVGMLPGTIIYVYLGYSASNIGDNPIGLILSILLLVLFTVIMTIVKKRRGKATDD